MLHIGTKVCNVRRPDKIGTVVSLEAPNNKWMSRSEDMRIMVKYQQLKKKSNGAWASGVIDELPVDLLPAGEQAHEAFSKYKRSGDESSASNRIQLFDRKKKRTK
jgi:hypothetical protein